GTNRAVNPGTGSAKPRVADVKSGTQLFFAGCAGQAHSRRTAASLRSPTGPRRHSAGVEPMGAWLTAAIVAALASVATAAQAQEGNRSEQVPASDLSQFLSPEPLQPRSVQTQTFRRPIEQPREVEQASPRSSQEQASQKPVSQGQVSRKRNRPVT